MEKWINRRNFLGALGSVFLFPGPLSALFKKEHYSALKGRNTLSRHLPGTDLQLPVMGLGTRGAFISDWAAYDSVAEIIFAFRSYGGFCIDTGPQFGDSELILGHIARDSGYLPMGRIDGNTYEEVMANLDKSLGKLRVNKFFLLQAHNVKQGSNSIEILKRLKKENIADFIGVTQYRNSEPGHILWAMNEGIDFIQVPYSVTDISAEKKIFPAALEKNIGVIVNRPFSGGALFEQVRDKKLPGFINKWGINSWSQLFLQFAISHPAVNLVLPGSKNPDHVLDNMKAGLAPVLTGNQRRKILETVYG
jgi:aryl-alcohol dehydrogenase-like predicted oxidoreductase